MYHIFGCFASGVRQKIGRAVEYLLTQEQQSLFHWLPVGLGIGIGTYFVLPVDPSSWIAIGKKLIAPFTFQGGCNRDVFNTWLETVLLPELSPGVTIIMDNAAFHKSPKTRELIENSGGYLLFLPTYSPDLNPIEHCWHKIKSILRSLIQKAYDNLQNLLDQCLLTY